MDLDKRSWFGEFRDVKGRLRYPRRHFLGHMGAVLAAACTSRLTAMPPSDRTWAAPFNEAIQEFMRARKIPGGALAVLKHGRLVWARGYGWADHAPRAAVTTESLFRIASLSKPITSLVVLRLVEQGRLQLHDRVFQLLKPLRPASITPDPRLEQITVQHLLQHTGGWDREKTFDPMFRSLAIAKAIGAPSPPGPAAIVRFMWKRSLDFDPGTKVAYSNFGYCLLGRIIELVSGLPYGKVVHEELWKPMAAQEVQLGRTLERHRAAGEVRYYMRHEETGPCVFAACSKRVPWPYGAFCLEDMDAHGGWIASLHTLARLVSALDRGKILKPDTVRFLSAPPAAPAARDGGGKLNPTYYGCGWAVRQLGDNHQCNLWHNGSLPGAFSLLVRRADGISWIALFNQRSDDPSLPDGAIDSALHRAADAIVAWPETDLLQVETAGECG